VAAELALLVERIDAVHGATHWCLPLVVQR
jgi:hypothetical protein